MTNEELWNTVATKGILNDAQHIELMNKMNKMIKAYAKSLKKK
jgi:hypothetical protein